MVTSRINVKRRNCFISHAKNNQGEKTGLLSSTKYKREPPITIKQKYVKLMDFFFFLVFQYRVSLYSPGCPGTHFVDQADLELRNLPASGS